MPCKCDEMARKIHEKSLELKGVAQDAKLAGDDALAKEALALSKALCYVSLFVSSKDEKNLNRLVFPYLIAASNMPKTAEAQARRNLVSRELCGNGD